MWVARCLGVMNLTSAANSFSSLVNVASIERPALMRVKPGDSTNSYIIHKLTGVDIELVRRCHSAALRLRRRRSRKWTSWIDAGAANN